MGLQTEEGLQTDGGEDSMSDTVAAGEYSQKLVTAASDYTVPLKLSAVKEVRTEDPEVEEPVRDC